MSLINYKTHLELTWTENRVMSKNGDENNNDDTTFKVTNTKLQVPIVTLSKKENVKLTKQFNKGFERPVYQNDCKIKIESRDADNENIYKNLP